jgi:deazaflavin-dependent oxidoreductase (nitroreductase family)
MTEPRADISTSARIPAPANPTPAARASAARAPWFVRAPNRLVRRLLRLGVPMGPNVPMTVRGRTSGLPRTAPVAVSEIDGRRYVIGAYGEVHWVRNLRAAGEATIRLRGRDVRVTATELDPAAARRFFAETIPGYVAHFPRIGQAFLRALFRLAAPDLLSDPDKAAASRPVFELHLADTAPA